MGVLVGDERGCFARQRRLERFLILKRKRGDVAFAGPVVKVRRGLRICSPTKRRKVAGSPGNTSGLAGSGCQTRNLNRYCFDAEQSALFRRCESQALLDIGDMDVACSDCGALVIGTLLPGEGFKPKFAQLYIYDTDNEVSNRLLHFRDHSSAHGLDPTLVADLLEVMDSYNKLVQSFRMVRDFCRVNSNVPVRLRLFQNRAFDARTYNVPAVDEIAALIVGDFDVSQDERDIVVRERGGLLQRIHETHSKYMPLQYPLLFPYGEDQYQEDIKLNRTTCSKSIKKRVRVSLREFIAYRLMERCVEDSVVFRGRRLFQQFIVDLYSMIESQRLSFIRSNQSNIRAGFLSSVEEAVSCGDVDASSIGSRVVLPSSFTGGRRYMFNNCQDAMAICKSYGYPDLFLTVTCNPKWEEIQRHLTKTGNYAPYRPDISCRVFRIKLAKMMKDFRKGHFFGRVIASLYFIEFQKRGLPHAHILLWLDPRDKLGSPSAIDSVICAELPDEQLFPKLFANVTEFMMHGPCGKARPGCPCMVDNRRRDHGVSVLKNEIRIDNRNVVPYNPKLIMKYKAHVNIEYCNKSNCIKYLFKYITKGVDRVTAALEVGDDETVDEIKQYYDCRYLSPCESIWRTFRFDIHDRRPAVLRLTFHLRDERRVVYRDDSNLSSVLNRNSNKNSMFMAWMEANRCYSYGRSLTYAQFPNKFTYDSDDRVWRPRKSGTTIGRLTFVTPSTRELYYMSLLLNVQVGCQNFEDIRTVLGVVYDSYREACAELRLLANDRQFLDAIDELSFVGSGIYLRKVFVMMLLGGSMGDPLNVWTRKWKILCDGLLYKHRRLLNKSDLVVSDENLQQLCLVEVEKYLRLNANELSYQSSDMLVEHNCLFQNLNSEQLVAYHDIINAVANNGKTVVFGGDFRQILPVIPRGSRADIVHATINSSPLWVGCKVFKLTQNMRLQFSDNETDNADLRRFGKWILDIGDGKLGCSEDGEAMVEIPQEFCIPSFGDPIGDIVSSTYPCFLDNIGNLGFLSGRAILAPTLEIVESVNDYAVSIIPGKEKEYLSCDSMCKCDEDIGIDRRWITTEFLNDIKCSGMPNHKLVLKVGVPIMLLRNIDVSSGLCNGTRLIVSELGNDIIGASIINGSHAGEKVFITRMDLIPSDANVSITFERRQFPFSVCYAMTINKSQGETLTNVGLYLPKPVFSHGQLYVVVSRVKSNRGLKILALDDNGRACNITKNVVYQKVFQKN
ncbi:ATP-dependent DNA helicase PIF1 [Trifolium pratense]|uniref:ATP-dependent DNA helicase n=1 Tax=Trifolium pratense TaxID=57577 RepID=A0A2K3NZZ7_TRIPR|nr:ATP-dependent DNA helicase PIF1 [Trifolium pratense]